MYIKSRSWKTTLRLVLVGAVWGATCVQAGIGCSDAAGDDEDESLPPSCDETGTYCEDNVLYDCNTDEL